MYAVGFLIDFAVMAGLVGLPFYIYNQLGLGEFASGVVGGVQAVGYAGACLVSTWFMARVKNGLNWAVLGLVLFGALGCLIPFSGNVVLCGALTMGAYMSLSLVWPALHSWIGAEPDLAKRSHQITRFNVAWSMGFAISPLVAGPAYDWDYRLPFILLMCTTVVAIILVRSLPHEKTHFLAATAEMLEERAGHDRASEVHLYAAWFANLMGNILINTTRTIFPKRVDELVATNQLRLLWEDVPASFLTGAAATKYSWLAFTAALVMALIFMWMGRSRWWRHKFAFLVWTQVLAGVAFWVLADTHSLLVMVLCFLVVGVNNGVCFFAAVYYSLSNPALKHRRAAIHEATVGMGGFIGSTSFGVLALLYGTSLPFRYAPVLVVAALIVEAGLVRYAARRRDRSALPL